MKNSLIFAIVGFVAFVCLSAPADAGLLVYEPFAYADGWLTGQGGALGTTGTWTAYQTALNIDPDGAGPLPSVPNVTDWRIHQEGDTTGIGVDPGPPMLYNTFDGTVANLPTLGGYVGLPGPEDIGLPPDIDVEIGRYMDASIALDPSVTASFQTGGTTWFSYVAVRGWDRNMEPPQLQIATDPSPHDSRNTLYNLTNSGSGIGAGGGPPTNDRFSIMPRYHSGGANYNLMGAATAWNADAFTAPADAKMSWVASDNDGFGAANIIVGKIEWDADTGGEDIISVVRFLEPNELSEAAFDAIITAQPSLSSANWAANKPNLDQSQFDTLNFAGTKFFVDEIRIGTTFMDVIGGEPDPNLPDVYAGEDILTWSGEPVELDPNVVNNDPCEPQAPLTYLWTANPATGVVFDPGTDVEDPNVTITKPATVTTTVTIANSGFETPVLADGDYTYDFTNCPGWSNIDVNTAGGVWNPGLPGTSFPGYEGNAPEGQNIAYVNSSGIKQVLTKTFAVDTTYTLTVKVGNNAAPEITWGGYKVQLLAGETVIAEDNNTLTPAVNTFETSTVTYTYDPGDSALLGQPLQIRLLIVNGGGTNEVDFDDVKLTAEAPTPVPYVVTLTLAVNNEGSGRPDVKDTMKIYVYDDACEAARIGKGLGTDNPGDFNENCITDANDLAELAAKWLTGDSLTAPIIKP